MHLDKKSRMVRFSVLALLVLGLVGGALALPETGVGLSSDKGSGIEIVHTKAYDSGLPVAQIDYNGESSTYSVRAIRRVGGVADWDDDGDNDILYPGQADDDLRYVDSQGNEVDTGIEANYVSGVADIDNDGVKEAVTIDSNNNVRLIDENGNVNGLGTSDARSIGGVADFNGDGQLETVYTDGNNNIYIIDSDGNTEDVGVNGGFVGGFGDLDSDGDLDLVYSKPYCNGCSTEYDVKIVDYSGITKDLGVKSFALGGVADFDSDGVLEAGFADTSDNLKTVESDGTVYDTGVVGTSVGALVDFDGDGNNPPVFDSSSINPDPPLIGQNTSYGAEVSDSDGSVDYTNLSVSYGGSTVVVDEQRTGTTTPVWNDVFTPQDGNKWLNATLEVVDDAGAVTTTEINRYLSDDAPSVSLQQPGNQTYWSYDVPLEVSVSESDSEPGEDWNCSVEKDGSTVDTFYLKEGTNSTYSDTVRSDLGSHSVDVSCTDGSGNTGSSSESYTVKLQELVGQKHPDPVYETTTPQSNLEVKLGEMASQISATLVFNSTSQTTSSANHTGVGNKYLTGENQGIPLVKNNATTENAYWNYTVDYTGFSGAKTSDTFTTPQAPQTIYQAIFNPSVTSDSDRYIEKENPELSYVYDTNNWNGDVSCTLTLNGTSKNTCQTNAIDSGIPNGASETLTASGTATASFQGDTRDIGSANKNLDIHRKILTDCNNPVNGVTGTEALQMQLLNEENRTQTLTGNIAYNFDITHHGEHTRNYAFDKNSVDSTKTCLYPDWAEYTANGPIQYSSDSSQNSLDSEFPDRQYNLINQSLDSNRDEIDLYLLPDQYSTPVYFEVTDQAGEGVENVVVTVQRYFIGSNSYLTIAKSQTDSNGVATTYLRVNEIFYKYTVKDQDGDVLLETNREILTCQTSPCTKELRVNPEQDNPYFQAEQGFSYNTSRITDSGGNLTGFQATVSHESSVFKKANLVVTRNSGLTGGNICNITASSNPSTLVCSFDKPAGDDNIDYTLTGYTDGNKYLLDKGVLNGAPNVFQDNAYFAGFILFAMFSMIGLASPKTGVIFSTAGIIVPWYLGFYALSTAAVGSLALVALALVVTNSS